MGHTKSYQGKRLVRAFLDGGFPSISIDIYEEMRQLPDPPLSLPYRVILKGLLPYPELRERAKDDFSELFPAMFVYQYIFLLLPFFQKVCFLFIYLGI